MSETILNQYLEFVDGVTSDPSKNFDAMIARMYELRDAGMDVPRLITASDGLSAESGEFKEVVKKMLWQGKPYDEDNIFHMKRELGDCLWYWAQACIALGLNPYGVLEENIRKLESRYPGGKFEIQSSEVRKEGDI
jgi:NTP pyrophosphatase (non-canonical NTP hydrolase)